MKYKGYEIKVKSDAAAVIWGQPDNVAHIIKDGELQHRTTYYRYASSATRAAKKWIDSKSADTQLEEE